MAKTEVDHWSKPFGPVHVVTVNFFLNQDPAIANLPTAFSLLINIRVLGVQVGAVTVDPLANGPVSLTALGKTITGQIDDFQGLKDDGSNATLPDWADATSVRFRVTATASVGLPVAAIPGLPLFIKLLLAALGGVVHVDIGHDTLIHHLQPHFPAGAAPPPGGPPSP